MVNWMKKFPWGKGILVAIIYLILATIIRQVEATLTLSYYKDPDYFGVWSPLMMPTAGPPPASFMITSLIFTFITGLALAVFYFFVREVLPKDFWRRVIYYSKMLIGLMLVLAFFPMYLIINLPLGLLVYWFISGSIIIFLGGIVFAKIIK